MIISNRALGIYLEVQYNPERITESKPLNWSEYPIQGMVQPLLTFSCGGLRRKRFELLLDAHASPHPKGHIADELQLLRYLTVPFGKDRLPVVRLPEFASSSGSPTVRGQYPIVQGPPGGQSSYVGGVPPVVLISYGGRVEKGVISNLEITELFHGTTPASRGGQLPTRATVALDFIVIDDYERLMTTFRTHTPGRVSSPVSPFGVPELR